MNVARLMFPVNTLGPGNRLGIWLCGCHRRCKGCSNPELWHEKDEYQISVKDLMELIRKLLSEQVIDGFTITGGEPLNQAEELFLLLCQLQKISLDILVYTGYTIEELLIDPDSSMFKCVHKAAVVVDGPYIETRNCGNKMVGSDNQRVIVVNQDYKKRYQAYLRENNLEIQNFVGNRSIYSIGIHRKGFADDMASILNGKECD